MEHEIVPVSEFVMEQSAAKVEQVQLEIEKTEIKQKRGERGDNVVKVENQIETSLPMTPEKKVSAIQKEQASAAQTTVYPDSEAKDTVNILEGTPPGKK